MEKAKRTATKANTYGNQGSTEPKASEVSRAPSIPSWPEETPVIIITRAVIVHITTVSIKGSKRETIPSVEGSSVLTAE